MKTQLSRRTEGLAFAVLGVWLLRGLLAHATTWLVTYDPEQPEDRVGAVAALAASGDSILIDPGTYYEHIPLEGKSLTFVGVEGPHATVLDGGRMVAGREGSIIYTMTGESADLRVEGLTFRNGLGAARIDQDMLAGGAIMWWQAGMQFTASLSIVDCIFADNSTGGADYFWVDGGGAVFAEYLEGVRIERSSFSGSSTLGYGGDLKANANEIELLECEFHMDVMSPQGIYALGTLTIDGCTLEANAHMQGGLALQFYQGDLSILDSRFIDHGWQLATRIDLGSGSIPPFPRQDVLLSGNIFWNAAGTDSATSASRTLNAFLPGGRYSIIENTLVRCGMYLTGVGMQFADNIVARAMLLFDISGDGDFSCNDLWLSVVGGNLDNLTVANNSSSDPLFCDEANGDFSLSVGSPCVPSEECDLIGAETVQCDVGFRACCLSDGCQLTTEDNCTALGGLWMIDPPYTSCDPDPCPTPIEKPTWGAVKSMFRW